MSRYYTDNPQADLKRWLRDQEKAESELPICECCGGTIFPHRWEYEFPELCEDCVIDNGWNRGEYDE